MRYIATFSDGTTVIRTSDRPYVAAWAWMVDGRTMDWLSIPGVGGFKLGTGFVTKLPARARHHCHPDRGMSTEAAEAVTAMEKRIHLEVVPVQCRP